MHTEISTRAMGGILPELIEKWYLD